MKLALTEIPKTGFLATRPNSWADFYVMKPSYAFEQCDRFAGRRDMIEKLLKTIFTYIKPQTHLILEQ